MNMNKKRLALLLSLLLIISNGLSACDMLKLGGSDLDLPAPPVMEDAGENVELKRDGQGMTEAEKQHLSYAKDQWKRFYNATANFGETMDKYLEDIFSKALIVNENKDYLASKDKVIAACLALEQVKPEGIPASMKDLFAQFSVASNRMRGLISDIYVWNGTTLPEAFNEIVNEVETINQMAESFFTKADKEGVEAAAAEVQAVDWAAEESRERKLRETFNVYDYGIKWGASRYEVMGVEGMKENAFEVETLSYPTHVYQYGGTRNYHFNEHGQLDSITYELNGADFDRTHEGVAGTGEPVFDDIYELIPVVQYAFDTSTYAYWKDPYQAPDGSGDIYYEFDFPAETVVLRGNPAAPDEALRIIITAKTQE